jgi:hypothetical protein
MLWRLLDRFSRRAAAHERGCKVLVRPLEELRLGVARKDGFARPSTDYFVERKTPNIPIAYRDGGNQSSGSICACLPRLIIWATSSATKRAYSSGLIGAGTYPVRNNLVRTAGMARTFATTRLILVTISCGVFAGAERPHQLR